MMEIIKQYGIYIFVGVGLLAGVPVVWIHRERAGVKSPWGVALLCVIYSLGSLLSAMLFAKIEGWLSDGPGGRISTYGIYLIGPFILMLAAKILRMNVAGVLDIFALYAMPSMFMMRIDCLISGCCAGLPIFETGFTWPTRETEMIFYVVMLVILWRMLKKNEIPGRLLPLLMVSYGCFRFVNQWFRDDGSVGWHMSHGWSVLCAFIGLSLLLEFQAQAAKRNTKHSKKK